MPNSVDATSQPALRACTLCQSCTTTTAAMVMESNTASGAAILSGMQSASKGTATSASPNPKAERNNVARKTITSTATVVASIQGQRTGISKFLNRVIAKFEMLIALLLFLLGQITRLRITQLRNWF